MNNWAVYEDPGGQANVVPRDDMRPHQIGPQCWCHPTDDEGVLVHHSLDRREDYEQGRKAS